MATFKYISKDMSAKTIRGTLEADDRNDLVRKLKEQNLFLVSCQDVTKKTVNQYKMKLNELSAYSREVGTMLASGLSLIRIFSIMVRREDNKKIKKIYENIYVKLQQGYTLSAAMEAQGVAFPNLMIQMYRSGEASGNMDKTALTMSNQYSKDHRIKGKTKSAMMYPIILIVITIAVLLIVYLAVLPSFFDIFHSLLWKCIPFQQQCPVLCKLCSILAHNHFLCNSVPRIHRRNLKRLRDIRTANKHVP